MIVTRGRLTVAQAGRPAIVADCVNCGAQAILLAEADDAAVDHRCATGVVGAVWTLVERPRRSARSRAAAFLGALEGGVHTAEQAAIRGADPAAEAVPA